MVLLLDEGPSGISGSGISGSSLSPPELAGLSLGSSGFAGVGLSSGKISGLGCDGVCGSGIAGESGTVGVSGTLGGVTILGGDTKTLVERPTSAKRSIRKRSFIFFLERTCGGLILGIAGLRALGALFVHRQGVLSASVLGLYRQKRQSRSKKRDIHIV